jgi:hypothetical protein
MLGYDYDNIYKKEKKNVVVDFLSEKYEQKGSLFPLHFIVENWLNDVHNK